MQELALKEKYAAYPEYKDSGVEWLGNIPSHWISTYLKRYCQVTDGSHHSPKIESDGYPFVSVTDVGVNTINFSDAKKISPLNYDRLVKEGCKPSVGDLLLTKDGTIGRACVVNDSMPDFVILSSLGLLTPTDNLLNNYLYYYLISGINIDQMNSMIHGSALRRMTISKIDELILLLPSYEEQTQIAAFLDHETAKIDTLIEKQQQLIELLKEKRQAVISHAVTKGLDASVPMKDSGVEWLGEVPEHWDVMKFNHCAQIRSGQINPLEDKYKNLILYAPNHIEKGTGKVLYKETALQQGADSNKYLCEKGEVIYSKIRPALAKVAICDEKIAMCSADMYPINTMNGLTNQFLFWFMLSDNFTKAVILDSDRVAMPKVNRDSLGDYKIPVPPVSEQKDISNYIKTKYKYFDSLEHQANTGIQLMQERRTALISSAVTGKIDVRSPTFHPTGNVENKQLEPSV